MPVFLSLLDSVRDYFSRIELPVRAEDIESNSLVGGFVDLRDAIVGLSSEAAPIAEAHVVLLAAGVVIFLGVAGEAFFKKTGIPDIAFLMILGVVIGPLLGIIQAEVVIQIVPFFAAIALIIIMFDGGLNLDFRHIAKTAHFASVLAFVGFAVSVTIVTLFAHYGLGWEWMDSILLSVIVGGSSSVIVFGLVRNLRISEEAKSMLSFESAVTDILATIIAFILFEAILTGQFDANLLGQTIGRAVVVGLILGFGVGIPWMYVTTKPGNAQHAYMLRLGILFVLFFMANTLGESGALTALVFGLMLGNKQHFARYLRFRLPRIESDDSMHSQLTFLVRSFFFVFVGLLASFGQLEYIVFGILATVAIYIGRMTVVRTTLTRRFSRLDKSVTGVMIPRGLAAAVLATLPITYGLPNAEAYPQIIFFIILSSVIMTTIGLGRAKRIPAPESHEGGYIQRPPDDGGGRAQDGAGESQKEG